MQVTIEEYIPYVDDDIESHCDENARFISKIAEKELKDEPSSPCAQCLTLLIGWIKALFTFLKPFIVVIIYSMIGAAIFIACERDHNLESKRADLDERNIARARFLYDIHQVIYRIHPLKADVEIKKAILRYDNSMGITDAPDADEHLESDWTMANAILFSATIYTTIGYGNIACTTKAGRLATIFYAIFGIPMMVSVLNDLGNTLLNFIRTGVNAVKALLIYIEIVIRRRIRRIQKALGIRQVRHRKATVSDTEKSNMTAVIGKNGEVEVVVLEDEESTSMDDEGIEVDEHPPVIISFIFTIGWLFLCAGLFLLWEEWTYFDSFYFFFISLSTIGFGDMTPMYPEFTILTFPLVLIGLALVSVCFNVINEQLELFYMGVLKSLLDDYTASVEKQEEEQPKKRAVGIMGGFKRVIGTKLLMPMMSKETKAQVMTKFAEEAKAAGIELPAAFTELDPESGMPTIMAVDIDKMKEWIEEKQLVLEEKLDGSSKACQTDPTETAEFTAQTEIDCKPEMTDQESEAHPEVFDVMVGVHEELLEERFSFHNQHLEFADGSTQVYFFTDDIATTTDDPPVDDYMMQTDMCSYFDMYSRSNQTDLKLTGGAPREVKETVDAGVQTGILARVQNILGKKGATGASGSGASAGHTFDSQAKREIEEAKKRKTGGSRDEPKTFVDLKSVFMKKDVKRTDASRFMLVPSVKRRNRKHLGSVRKKHIEK